MNDYTTRVQYSGYFQPVIRQILELGRANQKSEEQRVKRILEEERKKVWNVTEGRGKSVDILV